MQPGVARRITDGAELRLRAICRFLNRCPLCFRACPAAEKVHPVNLWKSLVPETVLCLLSTCPATFNRNFNHSSVHRVWNLKYLVGVIKIEAVSGVFNSYPQQLLTEFAAFRPNTPQSYPQAELRGLNPVHNVVRRLDEVLLRGTNFPDVRGI